MIAIAIVWLCRESRGDLACRRVSLTDGFSGAAIVGAEDIALDLAGGRLLLSAYDRREDRPGGIYAVPLDALLDPMVDRVDAMRLAPAVDAPALRPHGFGLAFANGVVSGLVAIQRRPEQSGAVSQLYELGPLGLVPVDRPLSDSAFCNANGAAITPDEHVLLTTDRLACDFWGRVIENVFDLPRGRVLSVGKDGVRVLALGIRFANGIAADARHVYLAATRDPALLVYDRVSDRSGTDALALSRRIPLGAAPDNLAWGDDGALYIAAHRSLLRFALFRLGLAADSTSAIYRYDPASAGAPVRLGWTGGSGAVSGATVALAARGRLVLGAGYDAGLSVCAKRGTELP
jgi:hypothetical protein